MRIIYSTVTESVSIWLRKISVRLAIGVVIAKAASHAAPNLPASMDLDIFAASAQCYVTGVAWK